MNGPLTIGILDYSDITRASGGLSPTTIKEIQSIRDAIKSRGHKPILYKAPKCQMYFHGRTSEILYNHKKIRGCDVLIPRVAVTANLDLEVSLVKQFQMMGIPIINRYLPIQRAKNKLRTLQILTQKKLAVPQTIVVRKFEYIDESIKKVGGYPVIVKSPFGSYGAGVVIVESRRSLYSALDVILMGMESNIILIQEYVAEADGSDYRAFVIGDRVVASMKRQAKKGEFRSNLHLGGEASAITLTEEEQKLAVRASQALGLQIAGVDLLRSKNGPIVMEVNSNPGFFGLSRITGIDVAGEVIDFAVRFAREKKAKLKK
ncbi:MAG TPA: RimK family alpha-L-glutamate ligase [Candidatus Gracilibacteria bacterium]|nr:RimK family alpha-L-glutamate ligase [Candidatus Gracilibacteria bacterium]